MDVRVIWKNKGWGLGIEWILGLRKSLELVQVFGLSSWWGYLFEKLFGRFSERVWVKVYGVQRGRVEFEIFERELSGVQGSSWLFGFGVLK